MGINRSHTYQRSETYQYMIENVFENSDKMWHYYYEKDYTILSTSSENCRKAIINNEDIIKLDLEGNLFIARGYTWKHGTAEIAYLQDLYENKNNK